MNAIYVVTGIVIVIAAIVISAFTMNKQIDSYDECARAGYAIRLTNPPQCEANGKTFTKILSPDDECTASGGTVATSQCCLSAGDFPNTCLIGACGCAPGNSHEIKTCDCGEGKCWNGNACV